MTGMELLTALTKMGDVELSHPVVLEQHFNLDGKSRACRSVIFDPESREIVILGKGPFD